MKPPTKALQTEKRRVKGISKRPDSPRVARVSSQASKLFSEARKSRGCTPITT